MEAVIYTMLLVGNVIALLLSFVFVYYTWRTYNLLASRAILVLLITALYGSVLRAIIPLDSLGIINCPVYVVAVSMLIFWFGLASGMYLLWKAIRKQLGR